MGRAWLVGTALKLVGSKGWFYRLAGEQARLIDDITGTTPPYDQTIVLGPDQPEAWCERMAAALGVAVAVVDVNDLGRVKVLAASGGTDEFLEDDATTWTRLDIQHRWNVGGWWHANLKPMRRKIPCDNV